jgi:hypothetical protein
VTVVTLALGAGHQLSAVAQEPAASSPAAALASPAPSPSPSAMPAPPQNPVVAELDAARNSVDVYAIGLYLTGGKDSGTLGAQVPALMKAYGKVVDSSEALHEVVGKTFAGFLANKQGAKGAVQVSQAADQAALELQLVQIAQNQRIIELLKQIAAKGAAPAPAAAPAPRPVGK